MLPYVLLVGFVILYISAKMMEWRRWPFYKAAPLFVILYFIPLIFINGFNLGTLLGATIKLLLALPLFYLLEKYQETTFNWLAVFAVAFILLIMI